LKLFTDIDLNNKEVLASSTEDIFLLRLKKLAETNTVITIHINEFCELLKPPFQNYLVPITERAILQTGFYGTIFDMKIYVSKKVAPGSYWDECVMLLK
jgi:hypothetical protein